ncbi:MAG: AAA family ATPase [Clostridium sp.]|nr:AAA family ATPase [Clostridium sp.]
MGVYLNPGNDAFNRACNSEIYIDKTGMLALTNKVIDTKQNCICVSRPRRFGKSMAAEMLAAYYGRECDSSKLFEPYKIAQCADYEKHLNQYNVIALNMQNFLSISKSAEELTAYLQSEIIEELRENYSDKLLGEEKFLSMALEKLYSRTKERFVFIFDEWDCIFRERGYALEEHKKYLDFLRNLLKDRVYVSLVYMTGILPIKKYGTHSALNMFDEYSMTNPGEYAQYVGFTEEEVEALCTRYHMDFEKEKEWYDGYVFEDDLHIYNPKSVVDSMRRKKLSSYWTQTETYEALKIYIDMNFDGLKDAIVRMIAGEGATIRTDRFQNDMTTFSSKDDVLTLLVHLGYLAFDGRTSKVFIPNTEILGEFRNAIEGEQWKEVIASIEKSEQELKYDQSAEGAIAQIKEKKYVESLREYQGNLLLVGINYDKGTKKHECVIECHKRSSGEG